MHECVDIVVGLLVLTVCEVVLMLIAQQHISWTPMDDDPELQGCEDSLVMLSMVILFQALFLTIVVLHYSWKHRTCSMTRILFAEARRLFDVEQDTVIDHEDIVIELPFRSDETTTISTATAPSRIIILEEELYDEHEDEKKSE